MKKIILLFTVLISALTFTSCADLNNDQAVAYSIGSIKDTWKGEEAHCKLIQEYLVKNSYQVEGISYRTPKDDDMLRTFEEQYEKLKKANEKGELAKVLHDQKITGGQITFDYGLLKSEVGLLKKMPILVIY